jgi:hypothetical protein
MASIIEAGGPARRKVRGAVVLAVEVMARPGRHAVAERYRYGIGGWRARTVAPVAACPPVARLQIAGCRELTTRRAAGGCTRNRCKTRKALIGITHPPTPPHRHAHRRLQPKPAILGTTTSRVLARLRITHDDFSIYQGYLRYAEIVARHASNAQDAGIFTI